MILLGSTKSYRYHGASRAKDDLCMIYDNAEFCSSFRKINLLEFESKVKHQGKRATFIDLDITKMNVFFIHKFSEKREKFPFFIVPMLHLSRNNSSRIFYVSMFSESFKITRCAARLLGCMPFASEVSLRMLAQRRNTNKMNQQIKKAGLDNNNYNGL